MAEMKSLNGYEIVDEKARNDISKQKETTEDAVNALTKEISNTANAVFSAAFETRYGNLLDPNNVESGYYENIDGVLTPNAGWGSHQRTINPISVKGGATVYIASNVNIGATVNMFFIGEDGGVVRQSNCTCADIYSTVAEYVVPASAVKMHIQTNSILTYGHTLNDICVSTEEITEYEKYGKINTPTALKYSMLPQVVVDSLSFPYADYGMPIVHFNGDTTGMSKDNKVTLSYKYGERSGTCTLKWQGSSSLAYPKKNYTVVFDNAFEAKSGWGEQKKYCLKANYIDFSHARNICAARLWGKIVFNRTDPVVDLKGLPNYGAIDGFPCLVVINGEYQGLYTFNIPKDGWMMGMGDGSNEAILCADQNEDNSPVSFHQTATTLDGIFDLEYVSDENDTSWVLDSLNTLISACINSDGTDIDTTIAQYLDINSAIDYFIFIVALKAHDCLTKNYILATYDGTRWFFSAYDLDSTFGLNWDGLSFLSAYHTDAVICDTFELTAKKHRLFELLWTYKKEYIIWKYKQLTQKGNSWSYANKPLNEVVIEKTFLDFAKDIPQAVLNEETKLWKGLPSTSVNNVHQIISWYIMRKKIVEEQLEI